MVESTRWRGILAALIMGVAALMVGVGCGGDVGEACAQHADCSERCVTGRHFPDGMCTNSCDDYRDCPGGTSCIDRRDGICMLECENDRDCPGGYECEDQDRHGEGGRERVCIGD